MTPTVPRSGHCLASESCIERNIARLALNALLREVPAPVVSKVLNRRPWRMAARAKVLGTDWANYAGLKARA